MVKEIRIYIEGGGYGKNTKALIRQGFSQLFKPLVELAKSQRIKWDIIICGSRNNAFRNFKNAIKSHPDAFNVLLVDAEAPVKIDSPWAHLKFRDNWDKPAGVDDSHCHLMVQAMEAWLVADIETLKKFYGQGFKENAIPKNSNVETIDKESLEPILKSATRSTTKGEYHKINHASKLLALLDLTKIRNASPYCDRLFTILSAKMGVSANDPSE
ncbi:MULTISPECIES: DUF4276 family protein [unclassified Tolypothrix]|uniref:DUF4276 family protein n=1 Tax=unclassified Tolypothrix TaxID=2649714 RepID=UPI0005EAB839|nr:MULTISPECIES: DUF4276 family protein [unclassified Tolypothrix]BAY88906.1 hypothetical protein NIES3275_09060 [Microchaete diplosiphon NIES-3275]EKF03178.1 hypothetical protein FDUTEX481_05458 [Tolypothrix sp. PCC 7601]MBE9084974.1 DUF4276 family protein [Tolypothrix sp. LEGE 11397]UYD29549.1 DUF4276 family protein [Tolypothrix sp. PCC 7712]UYD34539.1 DUF4276 family protein [Tolypothrix sp. PCC 7601]